MTVYISRRCESKKNQLQQGKDDSSCSSNTSETCWQLFRKEPKNLKAKYVSNIKAKFTYLLSQLLVYV